MVWGRLIPFAFRNSSVKLEPLSMTSVSGIPKVANVDLIFSIVMDEVVEVVMCTSIHFECASIRMRYIFPRKGPAWSLTHGCLGHSQVCSIACGGSLLNFWHMLQFHTLASKSESILGHQRNWLLKLFILTIPI